MAVSDRKDAWVSGDAYEPYVGRWSRLVAQQFLDWLAVAPGKRWLDVGCGTGALSRTILDRGAPNRVIAIDRSDDFLTYARKHLDDERVEFRQGDAQALPARDGEVDVAVSGLVLNFLPDQARAVAEMKRVVQSEGIVGAYVWDYAGQMQLMRYFWNAVETVDPAASELDEGRRFPLCQPNALSDLFTAAGLEDVEVRAIDIPTLFKDFDDYWSPFLGGQGPAPGYCMSLPEEQRGILRERIRSSLPIQRDGTIPLTARAWAVLGTNLRQ